MPTRRQGLVVGEQEHQYLVFKQYKGVNTQPSREAIKPDEFAWLENVMPIGDAFLKTVPQAGTSIATILSNQFLHFATIGTTNYQICFSQAGGAEAVNLSSGAKTTIAAGGTFTTPAVDQWKSERIVIADPNNGFFSWDGNLFQSPGSLATITVTNAGSGYTAVPTVGFSGGGGSNATATASILNGGVSTVVITSPGNGYTSAPTVTFSGGGGSATTASAYIMPNGQNGNAIAVYSGRVFIANNRTLTYTAPNTWYDFNLADAAGSSTITEGSLRQKIYGLEALDNYLYVFGDSSIIIIGDLKVTSNITTFSQTFLSSTTGSTLPATITAMERAIMFVNKYGVYALFGASVTKVSDALDGVFPLIDFTQNVSAGLAQIYNILCYVFSFTYNDPATGARQIQAAYFKGKWFFTSQGALKFVAPASINGVLSLWGTTGTNLKQLYADTASNISSTIVTGLNSAGNPIFDKQTITTGIEYTAPAASSLTLQIDTENETISQASNSGSTLTWYNQAGNTITWVNNGNNTITWVATAFLLDYFPTAITGKYLGATVTSNSPQLEVNGILMEYVQRAPWGP